MATSTNASNPTLRCGMVGFGMIFDETYRPVFEQRAAEPLFTAATGPVGVRLAAVASRTGLRSARYLDSPTGRAQPFANFAGDNATAQLLASGVDVVCVATPDDRHFASARAAI